MIFFCGHFPRKLKDENLRNNSPHFSPISCKMFARTSLWGIAGTKCCPLVPQNRVRNRCPYRRCGVDTKIPYRLFSLILGSGELVEAELTCWFRRHPRLNFRIGFLSSIGGRLPHPCLPPPFPESAPSKASFGGPRKSDGSGLFPFPLRTVTGRGQTGRGKTYHR